MKTKLLFILLLLTANASAFLGNGGDPYDTDSHPNPLFCLVKWNENDKFTENSLYGPKYISEKIPETVEINWDELTGKTYFEALEIVLPLYLNDINLKNKKTAFYENGVFCDAHLIDDQSILEIVVEHGNIKMVLLLIKNGAETKDAYKRVCKSIKGNRHYVLNLLETYSKDLEFRKEISDLCEGREAFKEKVNELSRILYCSDLLLLKQFEFSGDFDTQMQFVIGNRKYSPNLTRRIQDIKNDNGQGGRYENCVNHRFFNVATTLHWMVLLAPTNDVLEFIENYQDLIRTNAKDEYGKTALDYDLELKDSGINKQQILQALQLLKQKAH